MAEKRLTGKTILGYGFGAAADAAGYNFMVMYSLFYLTTIAGIGAARAGVIISVATIISALSYIVVGPASDNTKGKYGRRRPYLLAGAVMMFAGLACFFRTTDLSDGGKFAYYLCMYTLIYLGYGIYLIPYNALGAELTNDYDERTKLRTPATLMNCVGNVVGIAAPLGMVALFTAAGTSESAAWNYCALMVGGVCLLTVCIAWASTRGKELPPEMLEAEKNEWNPFRTYWRIMKMKPYKWIILILILFGIGYIVSQSGLLYYVLICAGLTESLLSTAMFICIFIGMIWTVLISVLATKLNKKNGMAICFLISAAGMTVIYFAGVDSFPMLLLLLAVFSIGNCGYWLIIYPIMYDLAELYEYKYGTRKEGALMSLYGFIYTVSTALGAQVLTWALELAEYDPALSEQSAETVSGITSIVLGIPIVMFVLAAVCCLVYPITKKSFETLMQQLERKKAGEETDESGLEKLI